MPKVELSAGFAATLQILPSRVFSTSDFIVEYRRAFPEEWEKLEALHGAGGKGAGQHRTVFTQVAHTLSRLARSDDLKQLDYRPAPEWWGNSVVQYWADESKAVSDEELIQEPFDPEFKEGSLLLKVHLKRERHWGLAKKKKLAFIEKHGKLRCERCDLDPEAAFGNEIGAAVIEVHHAGTLVGDMKPGHRTKISDLQCLCANCHRLVHAEINAKKLAT